MPALRNVGPSRHSGRLGKYIPVEYGKDGWPVSECINACPQIKPEPLDDTLHLIKSPIPISHITSYPGSEHACLSGQQELSQSPCSLSDAPCTIDDSSTPEPKSTRKNVHARRRDPGHIPRPRNAFIFFRSAYIISGSAKDEGQQNELSKQAGKAWRRMSDFEKAPYQELAVNEKLEHRAKYPHYVYAPGKSGVKRKGGDKTARKGSGLAAAGTQKRSKANRSRSSATSSEPATPGLAHVPSPPRAPRVPRAAAQRASRRIARFPTPLRTFSPISLPQIRLTPAPVTRVSVPVSSPGLAADHQFVPTSEIPPLELSPKIVVDSTIQEEEDHNKTEPTLVLDAVSFLPHLDRVPEQFGFKNYLTPSVLYASLPALPRTATASPLSASSGPGVEGNLSYSAPNFVQLPTTQPHLDFYQSLQTLPPIPLPLPSQFTFPFSTSPAPFPSHSQYQPQFHTQYQQQQELNLEFSYPYSYPSATALASSSFGISGTTATESNEDVTMDYMTNNLSHELSLQERECCEVDYYQYQYQDLQETEESRMTEYFNFDSYLNVQGQIFMA